MTIELIRCFNLIYPNHLRDYEQPNVLQHLGVNSSPYTLDATILFNSSVSSYKTRSGYVHVAGDLQFSSISKMGCFTVLKSKRKKYVYSVGRETKNNKEKTVTKLPEPALHRPSLQSAPPSFTHRTSSAQSAGRLSNSRARALSAPCSLVAGQVAPASMEYDNQEENEGGGFSAKDQCFSNPLPLPLPSPHDASVMKTSVSFKLSNTNGPMLKSGQLPLPPSGEGGLRNFSYDEVSAACQLFSGDRRISSLVYQATFVDDTVGMKKHEATVTRLLPSSQGMKEFVNEVNTLASLQHPQLCKLLGFHAQEGSDERMLIYERLYHGSLARLLYGPSDGPSIDWSSRIKVALCAAKGLAFLHDEGPFQAMYLEFSSSNIQVDKDFSAKISGYGCVNYNPESEISSSAASTNLSVETLEKGLLTPKSNVWSFGVVLLEILTGRKNFDSRHPKEDNIVTWSKPFLADDCRLSLIMDPRIKGRFPAKGARTVADIALKCLLKDPSERPTMRAIVESLQEVQDIKCPSRYLLQEPSIFAGKQMLKSLSLNGLVVHSPASNFSSSPPSRRQPLVSPRVSMSALQRRQTCSTTLSPEDNKIHSIRRSPSPSPIRPRVQGF